MQAVIRTGGKQYTVKAGDVIKVEKLAGSTGDVVDFSDVLMVAGDAGIKIGSPVVENATVKGKILGNQRAKKIIIFKFRRRKGYRRKNGHRQTYTHVEITDILS